MITSRGWLPDPEPPDPKEPDPEPLMEDYKDKEGTVPTQKGTERIRKWDRSSSGELVDHRQEKYKPPDPAPKRVGDGTGELQSSKRVAGQTTKVTKPQVIQED